MLYYQGFFKSLLVTSSWVLCCSFGASLLNAWGLPTMGLGRCQLWKANAESQAGEILVADNRKPNHGWLGLLASIISD